MLGAIVTLTISTLITTFIKNVVYRLNDIIFGIERKYNRQMQYNQGYTNYQ